MYYNPLADRWVVSALFIKPAKKLFRFLFVLIGYEVLISLIWILRMFVEHYSTQITIKIRI
jgi:hypothetical protein